MKRIIFPLLFIQLIYNSANGQGHFIEGGVITLQMDTLHGFIRDQNEVEKMKTCIFRYEDSRETVEFLPGEIFGYYFDNSRHFVSKVYPGVNSNSHKVYFFELVLDGAVNLYISFLNGEEEFYIEKDGDIYQLVNSKEKSFSPDREQGVNRNEYIGTLSVLFVDAPDFFTMREKINKTTLTTRSLISTAQAYHDQVCVEGQEYNINPVKAKVDYRLSVITGYKLHQYVHYLSDLLELKVAVVGSLHPDVGVRLELLPSNSFKPIRPYIDFQYERFSGSDFSTQSRPVFADFTILSLSMGISFPLPKLFYPSFIYCGISNSFYPDYSIYEFNNKISEIGIIYLDDYISDDKIGNLNLGAVIGYRYLKSFNSRMGITLGSEIKFNAVKINDNTSFMYSFGLKAGFIF